MRPPSVFVRPLAPAEGQRLKRLSRQAKHTSTRQRAAILLASATEMSAREIAEMWMTDESHVRKVIHDFNEHGFASLRPRFRGGRPRRISSDDEARIVALAGARPDTLGVPLSRWSLSNSRSTCAGSRSRYRLRIWAGSSPVPVSPSSARAPGRQAPIPTTKPRPPAYSRSTGSGPKREW